MKKQSFFWYVAAACILVAALAAAQPARVPLVAQLTGQHRPGHKTPTLTTLPQFPGIPLYASLLSREKQIALIQTLINHKVSTWPVVSSRGYRAGKFTSTGIFGWRDFAPTEEQIARLAPNYDNILFGAAAVFLCSDLAAKTTGEVLYVDAGYNILGITEPIE